MSNRLTEKDVEKHLRKSYKFIPPNSLDQRMEDLFQTGSRKRSGSGWMIPAWAGAPLVIILFVAGMRFSPWWLNDSMSPAGNPVVSVITNTADTPFRQINAREFFTSGKIKITQIYPDLNDRDRGSGDGTVAEMKGRDHVIGNESTANRPEKYGAVVCRFSQSSGSDTGA